MNKKMLSRLCLCLMGVCFGVQVFAGCPRDDLQLSEICFLPSSGEAQWVEISNEGTNLVSSAGVEIVSNDGSYSLPDDLDSIPTNGVVVVYFDGLGVGADDYSFAGDGKAELHTEAGVTDILGAPVGFCSLYRVTGAYSKETLLDFVAWGGEPGDAAEDAVAKRIWSRDNVHLWTDPDNLPVGPGGWSVVAGDSILRDDEGYWTHQPGEVSTSKGEVGVLAPEPIFPPDGMALLGSPARLTFYEVPNVKLYEVQISEDSQFVNIIRTVSTDDANVGISLEPELPLNKVYWWRIRSIVGSEVSEWSSSRSFTVGHPPVSETGGDTSFILTKGGFSVAGQVTDTRTAMGLMGCQVQIDGQSASTDASGNFTVTEVSAGNHALAVTRDNYTFPAASNISVAENVTGVSVSGTGDSKTLAVASLGARKETTMLAITPGATSKVMCNRDNTSNQAWDLALPRATHQGTDLESWWCWAVGATMINRYYTGTITRDEVVYEVKGDLLHDRDAGAGVAQCKQALRYALDTDNAHIDDLGRKPTEAEIKAWIDGDRPVYTSQPGHIMVARAYKYENGKLYVEHLNTDNNGNTEWREWSTVVLHGGTLCWAPKSGLVGIKTDALVSADSDGDGVNDFDEDKRFSGQKGTSDSDDDMIDDKNEIASYVFPRGAPNGGNVNGQVMTDPDPDNDGKKPPVDSDSDDGGIEDGEEDLDYDGRLDADEGDVFDPDDDGVLDLIFCIDTTGSMGGDIDQVKANAVSIVNSLEDKFPSYRVGLIDYRDFASRTGDSGDYPAQTQLSFSDDQSAIVNAINALDLGYGGDYEETVYSGIIHALSGNAGGWRKEAKKAIIVMGDAPPLDPEPVTGYTLLSVAARSILGGVAIAVKSDEGDEFTGPIPVYTIPTASGSESYFADLASETGGKTISALSSSDVPAAFEAAIDDISRKPSVKLQVDGGMIGATSIVANASQSVDFDGCGIMLYEWDWDGDGAYDESTFSPVVSHDYPAGFAGKVTVRVTTVLDKTNTDTYLVVTDEGAIIDVTLGVTTTFNSWGLDYSTGAMVASITIQNDGAKSDVPLEKAFWYAIDENGTLRLVETSGTTNGLAYYDVTDQVEALLPGIGNGDLKLDVGESVTFTVPIYTSDRSIPDGHVYAIWADPPVTSQHYHAFDESADYVIDDFEVLSAIDAWKDGSVDDFGLLEAIQFWKAGGYSYDESSESFVPGE